MDKPLFLYSPLAWQVLSMQQIKEGNFTAIYRILLYTWLDYCDQVLYVTHKYNGLGKEPNLIHEALKLKSNVLNDIPLTSGK